MELTYTKVGDYYIPDLVLDEPEPVRTIGKYGSLRRSYLKQHRRSFYQELVTSGKLQDHLIDIEDTAHDPMAWVGLMNSCKAQVEEIIFAELVYC